MAQLWQSEPQFLAIAYLSSNGDPRFLRSIAAEDLARMAAEACRKDISFSCTIDPGVQVSAIEAAAMLQLFKNLARVKLSEGRAALRVSAAPEADG